MVSPGSTSGRSRDAVVWLIFVALALLLQGLYAYAFIIEPNWVTVTQVKIASPRLARALSGFKVVQLSDLHIEELGFREISVIEKVNRIKPDIVLITGDMVGTREGVRALWSFLSLLEPKEHTYAVFGESDGVIADLRGARQWASANVSLIDGKSLHLNLKGGADTAFWLLGSPSDEELGRVRALNAAGEPVVVVQHRTEQVKQDAVHGADLVVCGHTHGGQVRLPFVDRIFPYARRSPYLSGLFKVKDTLLYVNVGIGSEKGVRFLVPPEITVFTFVPERGSRYRVLPQDR